MKKRGIRALTLALAVCCLIGLAAPAHAAYFPDVSGLSTEYRDAINYTTDNGIFAGHVDGTFGPYEELTRAQAVAILFRMSGDGQHHTEASCFTDVPSTAYYYDAVGWGVANGIVAGTTATTFRPDNTLTKQEMITFLYRTADADGSLPLDAESISDAGDIDDVRPYAVTPLGWAYSYGILTRSYSWSYIYPTENVTRMDAALYLTRYRNNVEGIVFGRDNFSFWNTEYYFMSPTYHCYAISSADRNKLIDFSQSEGAGGAIFIDSKMNTGSWDGSCYGMSAAVILDYLGKIDMNGNFANSCSTMYSVPSLRNYSYSQHKQVLNAFADGSAYEPLSEVESKINMYHISQCVFDETSEWSVPDSSSSESYTGLMLENLVEDFQHSGIGLFSFYYQRSDGSSYGHCVVIYGKPIASTGGYTFNIYDPRFPTDKRTITISTSGNYWKAYYKDSSNTLRQILCFKCEKEFDALEDLDIDSEYNERNGSTSSNETILDRYDKISIRATGDFEVTNDRGETLQFTGGGISGDMPVYGSDFIIYSPETPCEFMFLVEPSGNYQCTVGAGAEILAFYAVDEDSCCGSETAAGSGWTSVSATPNGVFTVVRREVEE